MMLIRPELGWAEAVTEDSIAMPKQCELHRLNSLQMCTAKEGHLAGRRA